MPTGSYDSSVVSTFILATQPLNLYSDNIGAVPFAYQPLNIVVNTPFIYVAPPPPPLPIIPQSTVIIGVQNHPFVIIDSNASNASEVIIIA